MMSIVRRRSGVSQCDRDSPAFKGGLPTDKGWRKGWRTDSRLLAQAANKTVVAQVDIYIYINKCFIHCCISSKDSLVCVCPNKIQN